MQLLYNEDLFDAAGIPAPEPWPPMTPDEFVDLACQSPTRTRACGAAARLIRSRTSRGELFFSEDGRTATFNSPDVVHQFEVLASGFENKSSEL